MAGLILIRAPPEKQRNAFYIPLAYKWLLDNLHNPYPTKETRSEIAASTDSDSKDVDAWFVDARKRIGWNQLRKEHFPKRRDLIEAATLFFKPVQSAISSSTLMRSTVADNRHLEFANQFVQIEERARELYSTKLFPSNLASELDKPQLSPNTESKGPEYTQHQRTSYPSPDYSPTRASVPLPSHKSGQKEHITLKRKLSTSIDTLSDNEQSVCRSAKRAR